MPDEGSEMKNSLLKNNWVRTGSCADLAPDWSEQV